MKTYRQIVVEEEALRITARFCAMKGDEAGCEKYLDKIDALYAQPEPKENTNARRNC